MRSCLPYSCFHLDPWQRQRAEATVSRVGPRARPRAHLCAQDMAPAVCARCVWAGTAPPHGGGWRRSDCPPRRKRERSPPRPHRPASRACNPPAARWPLARAPAASPRRAAVAAQVALARTHTKVAHASMPTRAPASLTAVAWQTGVRCATTMACSRALTSPSSPPPPPPLPFFPLAGMPSRPAA